MFLTYIIIGEAIRELIVKDVIQLVPTRRGKRTGIFRTLQKNNKTLQGIKERWEMQHGKLPVKKTEQFEKTTSPDEIQEELL